LDLVSAGADPGDDLAQNSRPILERSAVLPRPGKRAQELVKQITVAVFDIHEIRACIPRDSCALNVMFNQPLDVAVGPDLLIACDLKSLIEDWMAVSDARFHAEFIIRFAKAS